MLTILFVARTLCFFLVLHRQTVSFRITYFYRPCSRKTFVLRANYRKYWKGNLTRFRVNFHILKWRNITTVPMPKFPVTEDAVWLHLSSTISLSLPDVQGSWQSLILGLLLCPLDVLSLKSHCCSQNLAPLSLQVAPKTLSLGQTHTHHFRPCDCDGYWVFLTSMSCYDLRLLNQTGLFPPCHKGFLLGR